MAISNKKYRMYTYKSLVRGFYYLPHTSSLIEIIVMYFCGVYYLKMSYVLAFGILENDLYAHFCPKVLSMCPLIFGERLLLLISYIFQC
jgi:hypothetical protein